MPLPTTDEELDATLTRMQSNGAPKEALQKVFDAYNSKVPIAQASKPMNRMPSLDTASLYQDPQVQQAAVKAGVPSQETAAPNQSMNSVDYSTETKRNAFSQAQGREERGQLREQFNGETYVGGLVKAEQGAKDVVAADRKALDMARQQGEDSSGVRAFTENRLLDVRQALEPGIAILTKAVEPIFKPISETANELGQAVGEWGQSHTGALGQNLSAQNQLIDQKTQQLTNKLLLQYHSLPEQDQRRLKNYGFAINDMAQALMSVAGGGKAAPLAKKGVAEFGAAAADAGGIAAQKVGEIATQAAQGAKTTLTKAVETVTKPRFVTARNDLAESMLNSMIKVDPAKGAEHFYKLSKGQTMGNFLLERDLIGIPEQVVEKLANRFNTVKNTFDDAITKIEGNYKFPAVKDAIEEMEQRFTRTKGKELSRVQQLRDKFETEGLTMAENLEMKRLYERKVKTGYLKDNNSELVERATNIDSQIREDFVKTAMNSGFENVKDLSTEIQLTKAAMDSIESKAIRRLVNNQFSLTDNLLLVGGAINPSSLAVLGVKKITSSPSVQAKLIKALATNDIKTMRAIPNIPTEIINAKNAAKRKQLFENWLETSGIKQVMNGTEMKKLPAPKSIQLKESTDSLDARGQQYRSGTGVFEN